MLRHDLRYNRHCEGMIKLVGSGWARQKSEEAQQNWRHGTSTPGRRREVEPTTITSRNWMYRRIKLESLFFVYFKGDPGSTWEEPKESQADQGTSKQPGGVPLALLPFPNLPGLPPGSSLGHRHLKGPLSLFKILAGLIVVHPSSRKAPEGSRNAPGRLQEGSRRLQECPR